MAAVIEEKLSLIIVAIIWMSSGLLSLIVYFLFPSDLYYWDKVCDKCTTRSARYQYVVRFVFGSFKPQYILQKNTISLEVCDSKQPLLTLQISPKQMMASVQKSESETLKVCRFLVYRKDPLLDIRTIVINHNGLGSINVNTIEIQDLTATEANVSYVGQPVNAFPRDKAIMTQSYPAATREPRILEPELTASETLRPLEYIVLMFFGINFILAVSLYVIPCSDILCNDFRDGYYASVFTGLTSSASTAAAFVCLTILFRYVIKRQLRRANGKGTWVVITWLFIIAVLVISLGLGAVAAYQASFRHKFPPKKPTQDYSNEVFWLIGVGIAILIYFLFWLPIFSVIAYLIGFFVESEDPSGGPKRPSGLSPALDKTIRSGDTDNEENSKYYNDLIKTNMKVKSISQYAGVTSKTSKASGGADKSGKSAKSKSKVTAKSESKAAKKSDDDDDEGTGYYKQLMKDQAKVKSISQYGGAKK